ncbi:NmrA/HSCARG family protein [Nonomuraea sp. KM90]|uniref:NmrA/HSCARG family protein n=1 Tax=Nonomuraea sp. KM90 TaxID=3457428 RepID=UPI003FCED12F
MITANRPILVTGATGQQGGATARRLLADGWHVRALVRDPGTAAAARLARAGAELIAGDMDDRDGIDAAVRGAYGVFSVQPAFIAPDYAENELRRGLNVVDAAMAAGVRHLVYASVASADRATGIPHWEIKWEIEQYIRAHDVPATVLRPVTFMENFADPTYGVRGAASLIRTFPADVTVQLIALEDVGAFAALAFAAPDRFLGRVLELAGDELAPHRIASAIGRATGHDVALPAPPPGGPGGTTSFCDWQADIPALRKLHPGLLDFGGWLSRAGKPLLDKHFQGHDHR